MNLDQYQNLIKYLKTDTLSSNLTDNEKRTIINQSRHYKVENKLLYSAGQQETSNLSI